MSMIVNVVEVLGRLLVWIDYSMAGRIEEVMRE